MFGADGKQPRGLSRNQVCIAVGRDSRKTPYVARMGLGKPSKARTWDAYGAHIERGAKLVHNMEGPMTSWSTGSGSGAGATIPSS